MEPDDCDEAPRALSPIEEAAIHSAEAIAAAVYEIALDPEGWIRFDSLEALNAETNAAIAEHVGRGCDEPSASSTSDADDFTIRLWEPGEAGR